MSALNDDIRLEIFLNDDGEAKGLFYVDDGVTFRHETHNQKLAIEFTYEAGVLSYKNLIRGGFYEDCQINI